MKRALLIATILMVGSGCDKARELAGGGDPAQAAEVPAVAPTNLAARPEVLFEVFGERDDPRMIPLATIQNGKLLPIALDAEGWMLFDSLYQRSGTSYTLFRDGRTAGAVTVRQGMWERPDEPIYSLPNCELLTPLSAVSLDARVPLGYTVEFLASTAQLGVLGAGQTMDAARVESLGRDAGRQVAGQAGIDPALLDSLDFSAIAIASGAGQEPTIVATFIDPRAAESTDEDRLAGIFAIADRAADGRYEPSYSHVMRGATAERRRFLDHLDTNRDGTSEIVLEASGAEAGAYLVVLAYRNGRWMETFRSPSSWCLDSRRR